MVSVASKKCSIAALAIVLASASSSSAQLTITAQTPPPSSNGQPNTLVGQSQSFAASLLASGDDLTRIPYTARHLLHGGSRRRLRTWVRRDSRVYQHGLFKPRDLWLLDAAFAWTWRSYSPHSAASFHPFGPTCINTFMRSPAFRILLNMWMCM